MILKHRDRELIRFSWNRYGDVCNLELDRSQTQFLPLGLRKRMEKSNGQKIEWMLDEWIRSRTAPLNRRYPRERLDLALYFVQKRIAEIKEFGAKADNKLKVSLKRGTIKETSAKASEKLADKIVETLSSYPKVTKAGLARLFKVSERTIARCLKDLQDAKRICRIGSRKSGLWKVIA